MDPILVIDVESDRESKTGAAPKDSAVDVLARTIWGEARGESVRGKEAVALVVMNRLAVAKVKGRHWWGNCVVSICQKPFQFSCWNANDPNRPKLERVDISDRNFRCCLRIARRALAHSLEDVTLGATHYHTKSCLPVWAKGVVPCTEIGNHLFYNNVG